MKKNKQQFEWKENGEVILGVPPKELEKISLFSKYRDSFTVHKSSKKGKVSFLITKALLENLISTSLKIQKQPKLVITISDDSDEYILTCNLTKQSR